MNRQGVVVSMSLLVSKLNAQLSKAAPGPLIAAASEKVLMAASTTSPGILTTSTLLK
ncbi:MAG: hypothetical protein ACKVHP_25085 [Verrucomicrobiales bacterium]